MKLNKALRKTTVLTALLSCNSLLCAQDLGVKAPPQHAPIALTNATIHTISNGDIDHGFILFNDGVITDLGPDAGHKPFPANTQVIDCHGQHVYPGLISADTQLGLTEMASVRSMLDLSEVGSVTPEVYTAVSVNPDSTLFPVTRSNGILTAAIFPSGGAIPGRGSVLHLDGWTWEDMAVLTDCGLVVNWPQSRPFHAWWNNQSDDEQWKRIRENMQRIDDAFEQAKTYIAAKDADPSMPTDLHWEAMRGVLTQGEDQKPVFIRAQDFDQITAAVAWAKERGLKAVILGGRDAEMCAALLVENDVPVVVSGTMHMPKRDDSPYDEAYTLAARLEKAGVRWCMASGEETAHERNLPYSAAMAVAYGLPEDAAIRSITLSPAEILGVADTLGSLEKGKSATLIVCDGNPLEITTNVQAAYIDGRKIDLENKQTKLRDKYEEKYKQLGIWHESGE